MTQLTSEQCRLLQDDALVVRFNLVDEILSEATAKLPMFSRRAGMLKIQADLTLLAERMTRKRFAIGFIGPSQAGKSTTVGNLLSVSKDECPAPQGTGGPTTSVPTRLIPCAVPSPRCKPGERHAIRLQFMTTEEFRERVSDICKLLNLEYDKNHRRLADAAAAQHAEQPHFKAADHSVLLGLLEAARNHPQVLQDVALYEDAEYAKRRDYATHQDKPSRYTLLREVQIEFMTDAMSPEIEMIDLPGLGVDKQSDDRLTLNFLPQLDGAFMFQLSSQVKGAEVSRLAESMRHQHRSTLGGRVWMVVTRCDDLNDLQLNGPPEDPTQPSVFCHLDETLKNQGLGRDAVIFIGNAYYVALMESRAKGGAGVPEEIRAQFPRLLIFASDGEPVIPERCAQFQGQVKPWRRFVAEAGIPYLRETMQTRVAESVRQQTRQTVSDGLAAVINRLIVELQVAQQQSGMTVEQMRNAIAWSGRLATLSASVARDPTYVQPLVDAIVADMAARLQAWGMPPEHQLAEVHSSLARLLARSGADRALSATELVVHQVGRRIEDDIATVPVPVAGDLPTPQDHWAEASENYLLAGKTSNRTDASGQKPSSVEFRDAVFGGLATDPHPFDPRHETHLTAHDYLKIMQSKIGRLSQTYGTRLIEEIQCHLNWLADRYRRVGDDVDGVDAASGDAYRALCDRLTALL